jgi:hypothetical protein
MSNKKILSNMLSGLSLDRSMISKREKLWLESKKCRSCGVLMTLDSHKSNTLTIQHNSPKGHEAYNDNITIWCNECNQKDAQWKSYYKILSIKECIRFTIGLADKKINGIYVVDGYVYFIDKNKLTSQKPLYEWKLNLLKNWFNDIYLKRTILSCLGEKRKQITSFDDYVNSLVDGWFTFKHHHMSGGWYAYNQNPNSIYHWKYKSPEEIQEEQEESMLFDCLVKNYF